MSLAYQRKVGVINAFQLWTFFVVTILCSFDITWQLFSYNIRLERILVLVWLLFFPLLVQQISLRKESWMLLGWIALGLLSSIISEQPYLAIRSWVDLSLAVAFFFVCQTAPLNLLILRPMSGMMFFVALFGAAAIFTTAIHALHLDSAGSIWFSFVMQEENIFRIRMTLLEANLFGIAMAIFSLLSIAEFNKFKAKTWFPFVLAHIGLILSFSRGPIIGYIVGLLVYSTVIGATRSYLNWGMVLVTVIFFSLTMSDNGLDIFNTYLNRQDTINSRLIGMELAVSEVLRSPLLGNGIYSFSFLRPELSAMLGAGDDEKSWISTLPLLVMHDSGLLGLLLLYSFFFLIIFKGYKSAKLLSNKNKYQQLRRSGAWLGAAVSVLVASLFTPAYSLTLFWGTFSVCHCIPLVVRMLERSTPQKDGNTSPLSSS